jgi:DNA invertase Pin-like site-specific DNA recombinase
MPAKETPDDVLPDFRAFSLSQPHQWVTVCIRYDRNPSRKRLIGYARVSTYGQTLDSQLEQLRAVGCVSRNIYREKVTGARADRRELNRMLDELAPGDMVTVTRIDRLARSTFDLFGIVKHIVGAKVRYRSLAEIWADSTSGTRRLMAAVTGGLADVERDLIRTRTAEGRSRATKRGPRMGRKPKLTEAQQAEARKRRAEGAPSRNWRAATARESVRFHGCDDDPHCILTRKANALLQPCRRAEKSIVEHVGQKALYGDFGSAHAEMDDPYPPNRGGGQGSNRREIQGVICSL